MLFTPEISKKEFDKFRALIYDSCRIKLDDKKVHLVKARLGKRIRKLSLNSFSEYYDYVQDPAHEDEFVELLDAISTNTTHFFREEQHFNFLRSSILPEIVKKREQSHTKKLRIWCAASSSGEEPYTIAISVLEELQNVSNWDFKMLATDISTKVLKIALRGVYEQEKVEKMPKNIVHKYFSSFKEGGNKYYEAGKALKDIISYRRLNLISDTYPFNGPFDVIFCRNVMIYFDAKTREKLINHFYNYLVQGGYLIIGTSESFLSLNHRYSYVKPSIYRK